MDKISSGVVGNCASGACFYDKRNGNSSRKLLLHSMHFCDFFIFIFTFVSCNAVSSRNHLLNSRQNLIFMQNSTVGIEADDTLLWHRFKDGDQRAFATIFDRYSTLLLKYGLTVVTDRDFVKDCIQDLFVSLWQQRETISEAKSVRFYLLISLRRLVLRQKIAAKKQTELKQQLRRESVGEAAWSQEQSVVSDEHTSRQQRILLQEINNLPGRQREALFLRFYEELSYEEITEVMDLNYQVVRNMVHRAVKTLRQRLEAMRDVMLPIMFLLALLSWLLGLFH